MVKFAKIVSFFLGPMFILFPIPFILISRFTDDYSHALKWTIFSYAFILAIALFIIIGVLLGIFSNFDVSRREQRPLLFSFSAFVMFFYAISLIIFNGPKILLIEFFAIVLGLAVIAIVNKWIKASIHLAVGASVMLFIAIVYGGYYFLLLSIIPLLAWARVKTKEHTLSEVIIGSIIGLAMTIAAYIVTKQFLFGMIYN